MSWYSRQESHLQPPRSKVLAHGHWRADNCATGAKGTKEDCGEQTFACRAHNTGASQRFFNPLSSFETEMEPMERLALSWGKCARQFTKLRLSLLSHIGEMVGRPRAAPCSAV